MTEQQIADVCKALSVSSRLKILRLIRGHSYCVNAITRSLNISQPAVSQHLAVLKRAGLVISQRDGYRTHYRLDTVQIAAFGKAAADLLGTDFVSGVAGGDAKKREEA